MLQLRGFAYILRSPAGGRILGGGRQRPDASYISAPHPYRQRLNVDQRPTRRGQLQCIVADRAMMMRSHCSVLLDRGSEFKLPVLDLVASDKHIRGRYFCRRPHNCLPLCYITIQKTRSNSPHLTGYCSGRSRLLYFL